MLEVEGFRLGRRELEIMNVIWDVGEATVQDVCDRLDGARYTTVQTMLRTLEAKGLLSHRVVQRSFVFRAVISRRRVQICKLDELRSAMFRGSTTELFSSMLNHVAMTPEELGELCRLIDGIRR